jgi:hypothetical protein
MEEERQYDYHPGPNRFTFFAGVIMPAISITVEVTTHICADIFFDPIPTFWHLMLVIFVPLAQLQVWFAIRRGAPDRLALAGFLNAVVIGISVFYSIVYVPLLPVGMLALMFGLGLLPLAPYLSLLAAVLMRRQLKKVAATAPQRSFAIKKRDLLAGLALTTVVIGMIELPTTLTMIGLQMASSKSPQMQRDGIRFLREYGNNQSMLRSCFGQTRWATNLIGSAFSIESPVTAEDAQKIYYRVTGEAIDPSNPPDFTGVRLVPRDTISFDRNQGGKEVGRDKLAGLSLASSKLDATVDADGGVGYMEWTLIFQNDSSVQREARAEVHLPPGGVTSRLTLWVNGEEREAAFAGRGQVREAYQKVAIQQRRDPVLVTTSGRDRILVQCFPVPPNKGQMKIRLGITIPLVLEDQTHARLIFPHFIDKNFALADRVVHVVSVSGKAPMWPNNSTLITGRTENTFSVNGEVKDDALSERGSSITLTRYGARQMWSNDPFNPDFIITQSVVEHTPAHLQRIVLVVDTSASMQRYVGEIQTAIKSLPSDFDVKLVLADTDIPAPGSIALTNLYGQDLQTLDWTLTNASFAGGADNGPALLEAWNLAAQKPGNNAIVWIHSAQRMLLTPVDELRQKWQQRPYGPKLYSVQIGSGSDEIERKLDGLDEVRSVPRTGYLQTDLQALFTQLTGQVKTLEYTRSSRKLDKHMTEFGGPQTSEHLARLWANDEVARILAPHDPSLTDEAITLAARYQLVTPVTGAVVLETAEQYRAAGLEPVEAGTVPTIPEPEMVVLLIVAGAFMIWIMYMKYRKPGRGRCTV